MTQQKSDGLDTIRKFLTPILLLVIGYLLSSKLKTIDDKVDKIVEIQITMASQAASISALQKEHDQLRNDFNTHVNEFNQLKDDVTIDRSHQGDGAKDRDDLYRKAEALLAKTNRFKKR